MAAMDFPGLRALAAILLAASVCHAAPPETFQFAVEWRLIPAGTVRLSWIPAAHFKETGPSGSGNIGPSEIRLHLESSGLVSRLFRVNDDYTSVLGNNLCAESS